MLTVTSQATENLARAILEAFKNPIKRFCMQMVQRGLKKPKPTKQTKHTLQCLLLLPLLPRAVCSQDSSCS